MKDLKDAVKLKISNPIPWHFMALYYKNEKNYELTMKYYTMSLKYDQDNFNLFREQSYLLLYLRQYESFLDVSKRCIELRPNLMVNWITYAFANFLSKNYIFAEKVLDQAINLSKDNEKFKATELYDLKRFKTLLLNRQEKIKEALDYLVQNEKDFIDKIYYNEEITNFKINLKNYDSALENVKFLFQQNNEKEEYFVNYIKLNILLGDSELKSNINELKDFASLIKLGEQNSDFYSQTLLILQKLKEEFKENKKFLKSNLLSRFELSCLPIENSIFSKEILKYFKSYILSTNPSIIVNIKWIYENQSYKKIEEIDKVFNDLNNELKNSGTIFESDIIPHIAWFRFAFSIHLKLIGKYDEALENINKAIDTTPSVVEFFIVKSEILKNSFLLDSAEKAYEKAKKLDTGDRYLNAKHAKIALRSGNLQNANNIMQDFVNDPLLDENLEQYQTSWYIVEVASLHMRKGELAQADRLLRFIISNFNNIYEDQMDFFNYCLRRGLASQLIDSINFMDKVFENNYYYKALEMIDNLLDYIETLENSTSLQEKEKEFENLNSSVFKDCKYKFNNFKEIKTHFTQEIMNVIPKIQSHSKNESFHFYSVKYSILNNKFLFAYKSLNFLLKYSQDSIYTLMAKHYVAQYLEKNLKEKGDSLYVNYLYQISDEFKNSLNIIKDLKNKFDQKISLFEQEDNFKENNIGVENINFNNKVISVIPLLSYLKGEYLEKFYSILLKKDYEEIKRTKFVDFSRLKIISLLYKGDSYSADFEKEFISKFSFLNHPSKTIYNLDFYDIYSEEKKPKFS